DAMGRTTRQTLPDGAFIDFGYDGSGNLTSLTPPEKPAHGMQYTPVDLMASYDPPVVSGSGTTSTTYGYNLDRQLESLLRPDGQAISRTYDPVTGELTALTLPTGVATYTYDPGST
ncbi:MAG: RHS repeat protein, partial [Myxococcota bacterium]